MENKPFIIELQLPVARELEDMAMREGITVRHLGQVIASAIRAGQPVEDLVRNIVVADPATLRRPSAKVFRRFARTWRA